MRPTILPPSAILAAALTVTACSASFTTSQPAPHPQLHQQHDLHHWGVPGGNYGRITHIGSSRYALVSDKEDLNGWHEIDISFHPSGDIKHVEYIGFHGDTIANVGARDAEGIVYVDNSVFISAENDQQIIEMDMNGRATLRQLEVPPCFGTTKIFGNCGFEALAYDRSQTPHPPCSACRASGQTCNRSRNTPTGQTLRKPHMLQNTTATEYHP